MSDGAADRRPGRRALPGRPAQRARRCRAPAGRRLLRHLRSRQRRRRRAGAARGRADAAPGALPYHQARNEQGMVHAAVGFARMRNRLSTLACTASVGPGSTNMVTGAALATVNRLPVLLLPGDVFATRVAEPGAAGAGGPARRTTCRSTTRSGRCRGSSTGSTGRSSCRRRCSPPCECSPTRPRPVRSPSRCRRTCRPRRTTGRSSCSRRGSGTSPGRCPSRPRWPARSRLIRSARSGR